jgi:hypothetical protein
MRSTSFCCVGLAAGLFQCTAPDQRLDQPAAGILVVSPQQCSQIEGCTVFYGCIGPSGLLRVVTQPERCNSAEKPIWWGQFGPQGKAGLNSLIRMTPFGSGEQVTCPAGGLLVVVGLDVDSDAVLDPGEIYETQVLCHGGQGCPGPTGADGVSVLVITSRLVPGEEAACPAGGVRITTGSDTDRDGILDGGEVSRVEHACDGAQGPPGNNSLIRMSRVGPGQSGCPNEAILVEAGVDQDTDGVLSDAEVTSRQYVCDGQSSAASLVRATQLAPGEDSSCPVGGVKIEVGVDADRNGTLDSNEVSQTTYVCSVPAASTCTDGIRNGTETGIDCGGDTCAACPPGCPGTGGPIMVKLPEGYCIDSTEVTADQYYAWKATNPPMSLQHSRCGSRKTSYNDGAGTGTAPVTNVDWCDAYAYCKGVGKRLCGRIGGGANGYHDANSGLSQWYSACTSGGINVYPYGNTYNSATCNGLGAGTYATVAVGTMTSCQSIVNGYAGVYDLIGNVDEWEDSCDSFDLCRIRGGSFVSESLRCDIDDNQDGAADGAADRYRSSNDTGFRCCAL